MVGIDSLTLTFLFRSRQYLIGNVEPFRAQLFVNRVKQKLGKQTDLRHQYL